MFYIYVLFFCLIFFLLVFSSRDFFGLAQAELDAKKEIYDVLENDPLPISSYFEEIPTGGKEIFWLGEGDRIETLTRTPKSLIPPTKQTIMRI